MKVSRETFNKATERLKTIKGFFKSERKEYFKLIDIRIAWFLPRFRELVEEMPKPEINLDGLCFCGCGETTRVAERTDRRAGKIKGMHRRFIQGHFDPKLRKRKSGGAYKRT